MRRNIFGHERSTHKHGPESETGPTDSQDKEYPEMDKTRLRDGYKKCVGNASRLMNDAALLKEAGRFRSAYLILHVAVNELGHATRLYEAGRSEVQNWEEWWSRYFAQEPEEQSFDSQEAGEAEQKFDRVRRELMYVGFDRKDKAFLIPREDGDGELLQLFNEEAAYAESILKALPAYAFERLEFEEMVQQSPEMAVPMLYALIEEVISEEPTINERELLTAVAQDMSMSPDDLATGFEQWKKVAPKARAYLNLLHHVQGKLKTEREGRI